MKDLEKFKAFMSELQALLEKYNASINFTYDGDTHGTYDDHTYIDFGKDSQMATRDTWLDHHNTTPRAINEDWY